MMYSMFMFMQSMIFLMKCVKCDMIFEIQLIEYKNPSNSTYSNKNCLNNSCNTGFLFCLIDLPFRNPQNCTLGDHVTPVLGSSNKISFVNENRNYTYKFNLKSIPSKGIGMMIEVRNYLTNDTWDPLDFYTSALADVPLSKKRGSIARPVRKRFTSLFNHTSSLLITSKLYCDKNYFGKHCDIYCDEDYSDYFKCNDDGTKKCNDGFIGEYCDIPDICATMPCFNNGICVSTDGMDYTCKCGSNYSGDNCEKINNRFNAITTNPCYSQPCFNAGTCRALNGNNKFICECQPGYHGSYCEADLRRCTSKPCSKECKCIEIPHNITYKCLCDTIKHKQFNSQERFSIENEPKTTKRAQMPMLKKLPLTQSTTMIITKSQESKLLPVIQTQVATKSCDEYNPCRHGTCHLNNLTSERTCECFQGYMGPYCDLMRHPCDFKPCENNGNCEIVGDLNYKCLCGPTFSGINCELKIEPCNNYECKNAGTCQIDEHGDPYCLCNKNYTGSHCEILRYNPCDSDACKNNAKCEIMYDRDDAKPIAKCVCKSNEFTGKYCEIKLDQNPCDSNPCMNNATCENIKLNGTLKAKCKCKSELFKGEFCEQALNPCEPNPCKNNAYCSFDDNLTHTFKCDCAKFYYGKLCESKKRDCTDLKCFNDGVCVENLNETIECKCMNGYTGDKCEIFKGCHLDKLFECQNEGSCDESGYCECKSGFYGQTCEFDVDECLAADSCNKNGKCNNLFGSFECECDDGFYGDRCEFIENNIVKEEGEEEGEDEEKDHDNACVKYNCQNNSTCYLNNKREPNCKCVLNNTSGIYCEVITDFCSSNNPCLNNGICLNNDSNDTYKCECSIGFSGKNCEIIEDVRRHACDEPNSICLNNGTCLKLDRNEYKCNCSSNFEGKHCELKKELNDCIPNACLNEAICHQRPTGGYYCECSIGFHGILCEEDINICEFGVCQNGGTCIDGYGANYTCICANGYTGSACQMNINECESSPCLNGATCIDNIQRVGTYNCKCQEQYTGINCETLILNCTSGMKCENKSNCINRKCLNDGQCVQLESNTKCTCKQGFTGESCETAILKCDDTKVTCYNNASCILDSNNNELCICIPNFTGEKCDILIKNIVNQTNGYVGDASFVKGPLSPLNRNNGTHDNGVWLIVIVFGYIFGLFIIFIIIWFVWYGTSLRKTQFKETTSNFNLASMNGNTSTNNSNGTSSSHKSNHMLNNSSNQTATNHSLKHSSYLLQDTIHNSGVNNRMLHGINERCVDTDEIKMLSLSHSKINQHQQNEQRVIASVLVNDNEIDTSLHSSSFIHSYQNRI